MKIKILKDYEFINREAFISNLLLSATSVFAIADMELERTPFVDEQLEMRKVKKDIARVVCSVRKAFPGYGDAVVIPPDLDRMVQKIKSNKKRWEK